MADILNTTTDTNDEKTSTIKYVTWQVPVSYTQQQLETEQDKDVLEAIEEVENRKFISNNDMWKWIESLSDKK
jgi:hypothetical protein